MASNYDFRSLSPEDFQRLVADLLARLWDCHVEAFRSGRDKGVDLRASLYEEGERKICIIQCKRLDPAAFSRLLRVIEQEERAKVDRLCPDRYVLATSVSLGVEQKDKLAGALAPWCRAREDILGQDDINSLLRRFPDVERLHFKLWLGSTQVLERLLNADIWNLTGASLDEIQSDVRRFVIHDGVQAALDILHDQHHCLIVGVPGIGKTTLAQILLLYYIHLGFQPVIVTQDIEEAWRLIHETQNTQRKLIVLYDDFLGQVSFDAAKLGKNEESRLIALMKLCARRIDIRFILTTREYILADAKRQHAKLADATLNISRFVLRLEHYTRPMRARILFNHMFFSDLPDSRLRALVMSQTYRTLVAHENFNPRIIRAISEHANFRSLSDEEYVKEIVKQMDDPASIWELPFDTQIRAESRFVLMLIWSFNGPVVLEHIEAGLGRRKSLANGLELTSILEMALRELDGSFLTTDRYPSLGDRSKAVPVVMFHNPSIRDFVSRRIRCRPESIGEIVDAAATFGQIVRLFSVIEKIEIGSDELREHLARKCWTRATELLDVASASVDRFGGQYVVKRASPNGVVERLLAIADMATAAGRQVETAGLLRERLHPQDNLLTSSPRGTRSLLAQLLVLCKKRSLLSPVDLSSLSALAIVAAQDDLSNADWLADAADAVALLASIGAITGGERAVTVREKVRNIATSVLAEIENGWDDLDGIQSERDWLAECASFLKMNFDDLLEAFDDAITEAAVQTGVDDFDERISRPSDGSVDFDMDGLFAGLLDRGVD
jgi:hypothetical protein